MKKTWKMLLELKYLSSLGDISIGNLIWMVKRKPNTKTSGLNFPTSFVIIVLRPTISFIFNFLIWKKWGKLKLIPDEFLRRLKKMRKVKLNRIVLETPYLIKNFGKKKQNKTFFCCSCLLSTHNFKPSHARMYEKN